MNTPQKTRTKMTWRRRMKARQQVVESEVTAALAVMVVVVTLR